jgi:hypothetical protein
MALCIAASFITLLVTGTVIDFFHWSGISSLFQMELMN